MDLCSLAVFEVIHECNGLHNGSCTTGITLVSHIYAYTAVAQKMTDSFCVFIRVFSFGIFIQHLIPFVMTVFEVSIQNLFATSAIFIGVFSFALGWVFPIVHHLCLRQSNATCRTVFSFN